jgi:phosphoserine aminotransferase
VPGGRGVVAPGASRRASTYDATSPEDIKKFVAFMKEFYSKNK